MSLTQEQVIHIAHLAKLHITPEEVEQYQGDLNSIVGYIDILSQVPDSELQKVHGNIEHTLIPRLDEEHRDISREELLSCTPQKVIHHQIAVDSLGIRA
ncbi:MAG: Asp-tRNA(Asn)/Glu-tRNA(Gln) amidotransferase subunit GatC [Candidatus Gracilibacteria bacterium]|nr:Asp-tRNA(Asn)/Glu-tRNA(Gln) amidotransferase subunit GatC [Candidatus Gracilibacteria bacterium]